MFRGLLGIVPVFLSFSLLHAEDFVDPSHKSKQECMDIMSDPQKDTPRQELTGREKIKRDLKDKINQRADNLIKLFSSIYQGVDQNIGRIHRQEAKVIYGIIERIISQLYFSEDGQDSTSAKKLEDEIDLGSFTWKQEFLLYLELRRAKVERMFLIDKGSAFNKVEDILKLADQIEDHRSQEGIEYREQDIYDDIEDLLDFYVFLNPEAFYNPEIRYEKFSLSRGEKAFLLRFIDLETNLDSKIDIRSLFIDFIQTNLVPRVLNSIDRLNINGFMRFLATDNNSTQLYSKTKNVEYVGKRIKRFLISFDFDPKVYSFTDSNSFILRLFKLLHTNKNQVDKLMLHVVSQMKSKQMSSIYEIYTQVVNQSYLYSLDYFGSRQLPSDKVFVSRTVPLINLILTLKIWNSYNTDIISKVKGRDKNLVQDIQREFNRLLPIEKISFSWFISQDLSFSKISYLLVGLAIVSGFEYDGSDSALMYQLVHSYIGKLMLEAGKEKVEGLVPFVYPKMDYNLEYFLEEVSRVRAIMIKGDMEKDLGERISIVIDSDFFNKDEEDFDLIDDKDR